MERDLLCVMAKSPRAGDVKTRLAPAIGAGGAAALARAFLEDTLALAARTRWAKVAVSVAGDPAPLGLPASVEVWEQGAGDLGARMERAILRALGLAPRVLVVGTDSPGLPARLLAEAREALAGADAVLGPAEDGGFFLLGMRRCEPGLLGGLPWSRPDTLARTEGRLRERGWVVARTAAWFDVDEPAELARLAGMIGRGEVEAPATARALAAIGYGHANP